jgi:cysteine-rich repeat protein
MLKVHSGLRHGGLRRLIRLAAVLAAAAIAPTMVWAHGAPVELPYWGDFSDEVARCQRALSRAALRCVSDVTTARQTCYTPGLEGTACDTGALNQDIAAMRQRALEMVPDFCSQQALQSLYYQDLFDAFRDITDVCRRLDTAATSAVFAPALVGGSVAAVGEAKRTCVAVAGPRAAKLLRYSMRARQRALDQIASTRMDPGQKQAALELARQRIARARGKTAQQIGAVCSPRQFENAYGTDVNTFLSSVTAQSDCLGQYIYVQDAVLCPAPQCGNGVQEPGEECDDGNDFDGDGCRGDCFRAQCEVFANSFDLIQQAIFENHGCTESACHGSAQSGGLDLRAGASYDAIVDAPSTIDPTRKRVEPGDPQFSVLWLKLAAKTLPAQYPAEQLGIGTPMPSTGPALSEDELEALRLWIYGAASRTGAFPGVGELLDACLPEPEPIEIRPLDPPAAGDGLQLYMPQWTVDAKSEEEVCFATYYDLSDQIPPEARGPGDTFCYNVEQLRQDPLSHHLIVNRYTGNLAPNDPAWGVFRCRGGAHDGATCDPTALDFCGADSGCASDPVSGVNCIGFPRGGNGRELIPFAGAQETNATQEFPAGVYRCVPLKGMAAWNSHAFNLARQDGNLRAWVNFSFATQDERQHFANGIFNTTAIFKMNVPPFAQQEVCSHNVLPDRAHLFELTSHTHKRGKRFRVFRGDFRCDMTAGGVDACDPLDPDECAGPCTAASGASPEESLLYTSLVYNDPVQLRFDPPLVFTGSAAERTLTYCSLYDNGFTNPAEVKRQSTVPTTEIGNRCVPYPTECFSGKPGEPCVGGTAEERNRSCDSVAGAGDGLCDACVLRGGVRTEEEMFILLGSFYVAR